jgi:hypothetical protein
VRGPTRASCRGGEQYLPGGGFLAADSCEIQASRATDCVLTQRSGELVSVV